MNFYNRCRSEAVAVPIPLDGMGRGASGIAICNRLQVALKRQRHNVRTQQKNALKVLEILKNFFQEVFKQGLGQSPKVLKRRYK